MSLEVLGIQILALFLKNTESGDSDTILRQ